MRENILSNMGCICIGGCQDWFPFFARIVGLRPARIVSLRLTSSRIELTQTLYGNLRLLSLFHFHQLTGKSTCINPLILGLNDVKGL
ncbi:MAG: hypothetical protein Q8J87_05520, partial [Sediminibacterium sp.]|nr:hypothetical protein [Sediminibacterium sp.]